MRYQTVSSERWMALCRRLGLNEDPSIAQDLHRRYSEPQRAYHTLQHLGECLEMLDLARRESVVQEANVIEMAFWFHDAVYDPKGADNEERSVQVMCQSLKSMGCSEELMAELSRLIMVTKHHRADDEAARWLIDIDLSILGQSPARFAEYERQIRAEYQWVPLESYREKRSQILKGFLAREKIYQTSYFEQKLETQARVNLQWLVERLLGKGAD